MELLFSMGLVTSLIQFCRVILSRVVSPIVVSLFLTSTVTCWVLSSLDASVLIQHVLYIIFPRF